MGEAKNGPDRRLLISLLYYSHKIETESKIAINLFFSGI